MRYGSYVGKMFVDEAAVSSVLLKLAKGRLGDPVASGSYGEVSRFPFVVKRPNYNSRIEYKGNVLDKLDANPILSDYVVWTCLERAAGNSAESVVMQELQPLDQAIKRCPEDQLAEMKYAFRAWVAVCLDTFNKNEIYAPDLQIRNLAYLRNTLPHNFRLIDIDGLITTDGFECIESVYSAYVQFKKDTPNKPFLPLNEKQFEGNIEHFKSTLRAIQKYNVALILLVFDIRTESEETTKTSVKKAVAAAQANLVGELARLLKSFPGGMIEMNAPVELHAYCKSIVKSLKDDTFKDSFDRFQGTNIRLNTTGLQTTLRL